MQLLRSVLAGVDDFIFRTIGNVGWMSRMALQAATRRARGWEWHGGCTVGRGFINSFRFARARGKMGFVVAVTLGVNFYHLVY